MNVTNILANLASWHIETCDVLDGLAMLPDGCVHCCVTSPPYWGLRDYGVDGQIGLEETPEAFVAKMVEVFREVRRVLRDDGTTWINMGDGYANAGCGGSSVFASGRTDGRAGDGGKERLAVSRNTMKGNKVPAGLKSKDLIGIPWRLALALQADGWYLRSDIIWCKKSPMPESVRDRPTTAHEHVFLLTKSARYFYDMGAERAVAKYGYRETKGEWRGGAYVNQQGPQDNSEPSGGSNSVTGGDPSTGRNLWNYWLDIKQANFKEAHFATFPPDLPRRCLRLGTSEKGCCPECGAPWKRIVERERVPTRPGTNSKVNRVSQHGESPYEKQAGMIVGNRDPQRHTTETRTTGWEPGCECRTPPKLCHSPIPCLALDPFSGASTTIMVARRLGLRAIGFELNPEYADMGRRRVKDDRPLFN